MSTAPTPTPTPELLDIAELARMLGVSRPTAYRYVRKGLLPSMTPLGTRLVPRWAVDEWLRTGHPVTFDTRDQPAA